MRGETGRDHCPPLSPADAAAAAAVAAAVAAAAVAAADWRGRGACSTALGRREGVP